MDGINQDMIDLKVSSSELEEMKNDVENRLPNEACGFLIRGEENRSVYPITNIINSPFQFRMAPQEQLDVLIQVEDNGWDMIGVYHSHPNGPDIPSTQDIDQWVYPDLISIIWSLKSGVWRCRGFILRDKCFREIDLRISEKQ